MNVGWKETPTKITIFLKRLPLKRYTVVCVHGHMVGTRTHKKKHGVQCKHQVSESSFRAGLCPTRVKLTQHVADNRNPWSRMVTASITQIGTIRRCSWHCKDVSLSPLPGPNARCCFPAPERAYPHTPHGERGVAGEGRERQKDIEQVPTVKSFGSTTT